MESDVTQSAGFLKFLAWLEVNQKRVMYAVAGAIVVGLVVWYFIWQKEEKRVAAGESFSQVFVGQVTATVPSTEAAPAYQKVAAEYPESEAGARASLMAASSLFTQGKFAEAQGLFEKFVRERRSSPLIGQAQYGLAASLDAQGKTNDAVTAYKVVVDRRSAENLVPLAKAALARLYLGQGNPEAAYQLYQDLAESERFSSVGNEAGIRVEELKQKYPQLAPKPSPVVEANPPFVFSNTISPRTNVILQSQPVPAPTNAVPALTNGNPK